MATTTSYLGLTLLGIGEEPGTWGIPLNANFNKVDVLAGEIILGRGTYANLNARFSATENEIAAARGTHTTLNGRLSVSLNPDGTINTASLPNASTSQKGIAFMSVAPDIASAPISVGDNDPRMLTQTEHDQLTLGGHTAIHLHLLADGATDVSASAAEINQALDGISGDVNANVLSQICGRTFYATETLNGQSKLSLPPVAANDPIAIGDNDPRILTQFEHDELTDGGNTSVHTHLLEHGATDVTATATEINQALDGIGASVTFGNLTSLCDRTFYATVAANGLVRLSVSPALVSDPIAVGTNDTRILTQPQKDELVLGNPTTLHQHPFGQISDATVTISVLNQLTGSSSNVNATNLGILTGGGNTTLHHHDTRYYTRSELDTSFTNQTAYTDTEIATHNTDDLAHQGGNLQLGNVTSNSLSMTTQGISLTIQAAGTDTGTSLKQRIKNSSGVDQFTVDASGNVVCNNITVNGTSTVVNSETVQQDQIITQDLTVDGSTTLGDDNSVDQLVVNCVDSTFNGSVIVNGGITVTGTVDGVDVSDLGTEVTDARTSTDYGSFGSLDLRLENIEDEFQAADATINTAINDAKISSLTGPHATLLQRLESDAGRFEAVRTEVLAGRDSAIHGILGSLDARFDQSENDIVALQNEVVTGRGPEASLDARFDAAEANTLAVTNEVAAARGGEVDLDTRLDAIETDHGTLNAEVLSARNSSNNGIFASLDARLEDIEGDVITNGTSANATASEVQTARGGFGNLNLRITDIETDVDDLETEVAAGRASTVYATGYASLDARFEYIETILDTRDNEIASAEVSDITGGHADLDTRLEVAEARYEAVKNEVETARGVHLDLDTRLDTLEGNIDLTEVTTARNSDVTGNHANLDTRLETAEARYEAIRAEVITARNGEVNLDTRLDASDVTLTAIQGEVVAARNSAVYATTFGSVDARLEASEAILDAHNTEIVTARGGEASLDNRLDLIDLAVSDNTTSITTVTNEVTNARNSAANSNIYVSLDARLETIEGDLNTAEASIVTNAGNITTVTNEVIAARDSAANNNIYVSLDARLEQIETDLNAAEVITAEVTTARDSAENVTVYPSLDARLEQIEIDLNAEEAAHSATNAEVVAARGGEVNLDARLDQIETDIGSNDTDITDLQNNKTDKATQDYVIGDGTSLVLAHGLGTDVLIVQVYSLAGANPVVFTTADSITVDATNVTVDVTSAGAGDYRIVAIG